MSNKTIILGLVLAATAIPCFIPSAVPVAHALPEHEVYRYYYSTPAKTTLVGMRVALSCWGQEPSLEPWGITTPYYSLVNGAACGDP